METTVLGRTGLKVTRSALGALPIQRVAMKEAVEILHRVRDGGINFIDTARAYSDSEEKLGVAFGGSWDSLVLATKTGASTAEGLKEHLATSLRLLKRDCIDIYQFHNPASVPMPGDPLFEAAKAAQKAGDIRFIGITAHKLENAVKAAESGFYDTVQYPLSCLSGDDEINLIKLCQRLNVGVIAMKALAGGLLPSAALSMAFLRPYQGVVPIWGVQRMEELDEILSLEQSPPELDDAMLARIQHERETLVGSFCRACGYCLPCPAKIPLNMTARMPQFMRRAPWQPLFEAEWVEQMLRIENCVNCGACKKRCPYGLDPAELSLNALADWRAYGRERGVDVP